MSWNSHFFNRLSEDACKEIYFNCYLKVYIYVHWLTQDPHHAEIITLHTLLQVFRKGILHSEDALLASIQRIATDKCLDCIKKDNTYSADLLKTAFDNALRLEKAIRDWKQRSPATQEEKKLEYPPQLKSFVRHYRWPYLTNTYLDRITNTGEKELNQQEALSKANQIQSEHFATVEIIESRLRDLVEIDPSRQWESFKKHLDSARRRKFHAMAATVVIAILMPVVYYAVNQWQLSLTSRRPPFSIQNLATGAEPELILNNGSVIKLDSVPDGALIAPGIPFKKNESTLLYVQMEPNNQVQDQDIYILSVPPRRQYQVTLADSSVIKLNASSQLHFPVNFSTNERQVTMKGEAYFEVRANVAKPFLVNLKDQVIVKVTGTSFNIEAYIENDYIRTTLIKGHLAITEYSSKKTRSLQAGQQASFKNGNFIADNSLNLDQVTAWTEGVFDFDDKAIHEVMQEIEHWYNVKVKYIGKLPAVTITAVLPRSMPLLEMISILSETHQIQIDKMNDTLLIVSPKQ